MAKALTPELKQYLTVTGNYWAFTLTDGALRMLVVLHFHALGYIAVADRDAVPVLRNSSASSPIWSVAGWVRASGLNRTMNIGMGLQVVGACPC